MKTKNNEKLIAVFGATGQQGGGVVRALQANGQFKVRALTRDPDKHRELAEEVVRSARWESFVETHDALQMHFSLVLLCVNIVSYGTQAILAETARTRVEGAIRCLARWRAARWKNLPLSGSPRS